MSTASNHFSSYSHLGDAWLRHQKARIMQRHTQFGRHLRIDIDSLLARAALLSRVDVQHRDSRGDFMRRATIDAIEHCLRFSTVTLTGALEPNVA